MYNDEEHLPRSIVREERAPRAPHSRDALKAHYRHSCRMKTIARRTSSTRYIAPGSGSR
jgi:hypothetical protein